MLSQILLVLAPLNWAIVAIANLLTKILNEGLDNVTVLPPATRVKVTSSSQGKLLKLVKQGFGGSLEMVKVPSSSGG